MTGRIFTADHHVYDLPPLLSWNVRHTGTVPCDSWSVTAVYQPEMLTVLRMAAGFAATSCSDDSDSGSGVFRVEWDHSDGESWTNIPWNWAAEG